jgi:hypothetical protein
VVEEFIYISYNYVIHRHWGVIDAIFPTSRVWKIAIASLWGIVDRITVFVTIVRVGVAFMDLIFTYLLLLV